MVEVEQMSEVDSKKLLKRVRYGHPGSARETSPYVVPTHYGYDEPLVYICTNRGKKNGTVENDLGVCLQFEEVMDESHWQSVIITGVAFQLTGNEEIKSAMDLILAANPKLTPALKIHWRADQWVRSDVQVVYRITPTKITGRRTVDRLKHKEYVFL